jgi:VWFA-related protein
MPHAWTSSIVGVVVAGALAGPANSSGLAWSRAGAVQPRTRTVYVSVIDKQDQAVTDLQDTEFEVKVAGKPRDVVSAEPAKIPLRIALLVADQGTGAFQLGLAHFMQKLLGHAEFALISVVVQPEKLVDFSHEGRDLSAGLSRLGPRGRQTGAQLMEAIQDATKDIQHEERRPVIVVMRLGGEAATSLDGDDVREQLRKSGAALYVVSAAGAQGKAPSQATGTDAVSVQQGQFRDAELAEGAFNLAQVLGDGSKESGGRYEQVIATTHARALEQLADQLLHQYAITYALPDGVKPGDKLSVSSKRKGVTVRAPSRLPD